MAKRVVGANDGEALLLVESGDRPAVEPPGVAVLLQRGIVEQALALQPLFEQPVLSPRRPELLAVRRDHAAKLDIWDCPGSVDTENAFA